MVKRYVYMVLAFVLLISLHVCSVFADDSGTTSLSETPSAGVVEIQPVSTEFPIKK